MMLCSLHTSLLQETCSIVPQAMSTERLYLQVVAQHLFQEGRFAVGEAFLREAKLPYGEKLKAPFAAMHSVLQSVRLCPNGPAPSILSILHGH